MNITFTAKKVTVTDAMKERIEKKLGKLEKFFHTDAAAHIIVKSQREQCIVEITVSSKGMMFRAQESSDDFIRSTDRAMDKIIRQIRKNKTRLEKRIKATALESEPYTAGEEIEEDYALLRTKQFAVKPMNPEEAILQMNLLGHTFYMFENNLTGLMSVVYHRQDGGYGLIEPQR